MTVNDWVAIGGICIAMLGVVDSAMQRYKRANTSEYAAQRDFEHLKRNQEQLKVSLSELLDENESIKLKVVAMETQLSILVGVRYKQERKEDA